MERFNFLLGVANATWSMILSIVVIPFYLRYLGLEAYGLIGFFAALQAVLSLLDLGLAPTMSREVARCRASGHPEDGRRLLHTLAIVYWLIAGLLAVAIAVLASVIADGWLGGSTLSPAELRHAIQLMGLVIAFRWPVGLYSGALMGDGKLAQASLLGIVGTTITSLGGVLVLAAVSPTISGFFVWQAAAALAYVFAVRWLTRRLLGRPADTSFDFVGLRRVWRFSAGLGLATILGVVFMQSDKIILSRLVPLEALGGYTLAGALARVLYVMLTPAFNIIYPALTGFHERRDQLGQLNYYETGTQLLMALIFPGAAFLAVFATPIIQLWVSDPAVVAKSAPLVPLMVIGTALNGLMHFPYALQLATGRSRLPATINAILLIGFVPLLTVLALRYGVMGGAAAWAGLNAGYVVLGTYMTHREIMRGEGGRWLLFSAGPSFAVTLLVVVAGGMVVRSTTIGPVVQLGLGAALTVCAAVISCLVCPRLVIAARQVLRAKNDFTTLKVHEVG